MNHYLVFQRGAQDRKIFQDSGYPWAALFFSPLWAFSKGMTFHGVALSVPYGLCVLLMGFVTDGMIAGAAIALWLGAFTAHNATDWLTSSYEKRGYKLSGGIEADSAKDALHAYREPKRPTVRLDTPLTVKPAKTVA